MKKEIVVICGPTAVGKTDFALTYAQEHEGEIICLDAFQIYKYMPILSAAPALSEKEKIPHHLFDFISPLENFSLADYYHRACAVALDLLSSGKTPIFAGGTGLYLRTLQNGFVENAVPPDPQFRQEMEKIASEQGNEILYDKLQKLNPARAGQIHVNDRKRLIRALELCLCGQKGVAGSRLDLLSDCKWHKICVIRERSELYQRIEKRIDNMVALGITEEVKGLLELGVVNSHTAAQALGFKETVAYLQGDLNYDEWLSLFKKNTRHFAKRQLTWLRSEDNLQFLNLK